MWWSRPLDGSMQSTYEKQTAKWVQVKIEKSISEVQTSPLDDHFEQLCFVAVHMKEDSRDVVFPSLNIKLQNGTRERPATLTGQSKLTKEHREIFSGAYIQTSLLKCTTVLAAYNGEHIRHCGTMAIPCEHRHHKCAADYMWGNKEGIRQHGRFGVITKVTKPTDWVTSLVYGRKSNGRLRVCFDPKDLNKAIKRPHHITPSVDEITHAMADTTVFAKLDPHSTPTVKHIYMVDLGQPKQYQAQGRHSISPSRTDWYRLTHRVGLAGLPLSTGWPVECARTGWLMLEAGLWLRGCSS